MKLRFRQRILEFPRRAVVMGIVNVNDDSFCADGSLEQHECTQQIRNAIASGADVIDIGAESARTNRAAISVAEEIRRFSLVLPRWREIIAAAQPIDADQVWPPILSANTWRSEVVQAVLEMGAEWINDMSGLTSPKNAEHCAEYAAALLIMHSVGEPKVPHFHQAWPDIIAELETFFAARIATAAAAGLSPDYLLLDPGIDFAKQMADNLTIYAQLDRLRHFERPLLVPVSRKTVIRDALGIEDPLERDAATIASMTWCLHHGGHIFRVHNVPAAYQVAKLFAGSTAPSLTTNA
jgi:dihydropteroate synthase